MRREEARREWKSSNGAVSRWNISSFFFFFFGYILFLPLVLLNESNDTVPRKRDPNTPGGG